MEALILFVLVWLPFSIFTGWLASKRGRSGLGWGVLSFLVSPVIALLALLLLQDLAAETIKLAREESRFRDQLAALSDIKENTQARDVVQKSPPKDTNCNGTESKIASYTTSTTTQTLETQVDKPQSEAVTEPIFKPTTPVASPAIGDAVLLSPNQSVSANAGNPTPLALKRKVFGPMLIAVSILIVAVAILGTYIIYLQKSMNLQRETVSFAPNNPLVIYKVEEFKDAKCLVQTCNRLVVSIDGNRLVGADDEYIEIEAQGDFNSDGILDTLISTSCGGSGCLVTHQFVSISDGKIVVAPVSLNSDFEFMEDAGRFVIKTTIGSSMEFWGFDGKKAIKVRSVQLPLKTIGSTVLCLQNKKIAACPNISDIYIDDKTFKKNFDSILKMSTISISDRNSFFERGLTGGFIFIKKKNVNYLITDWYSKSTGIQIDLLIEIKGESSGSGGNRLIAKYSSTAGVGEVNWLNDPTILEKEILNNPVSDLKEAESESTKVESKASPPVPSNKNVWFTPEAGFTECIEARTGPADRIEDSKGRNPSVIEKNGGRVVQVTADYDLGRTVTWMFYRDKAECERIETNVEKKMADKYR